jgi:acyl-coenzyme A thioesterase PaaI-like protein
MATTITMDTNATTIESTAALRDSHRGCFACGPGNDKGLGLRFEITSDGAATALWEPSDSYRSYPDRLHGGVIATLLDCAMVHALFARGISAATAEMTIRYHQSVGLRRPLHLTGSVIAERHGLFICRAELHQGGMHMARASGKFMCIGGR